MQCRMKGNSFMLVLLFCLRLIMQIQIKNSMICSTRWNWRKITHQLMFCHLTWQWNKLIGVIDSFTKDPWLFHHARNTFNGVLSRKFIKLDQNMCRLSPRSSAKLELMWQVTLAIIDRPKKDSIQMYSLFRVTLLKSPLPVWLALFL